MTNKTERAASGEKLYRIGDALNAEERAALGVTVQESRPYTSMGLAPTRVKAIVTGQFRPPKKGEWYLSGAIVEAYRAPNDLSTAFHIARLVKVKTTTTIVTEIEEPENWPAECNLCGKSGMFKTLAKACDWVVDHECKKRAPFGAQAGPPDADMEAAEQSHQAKILDACETDEERIATQDYFAG